MLLLRTLGLLILYVTLATAAGGDAVAGGDAHLVCGAPDTLRGPLPLSPTFDFFMLRLFWAPALYATDVDGAAQARAVVQAGEVAGGGWW